MMAFLGMKLYTQDVIFLYGTNKVDAVIGGGYTILFVYGFVIIGV